MGLGLPFLIAILASGEGIPAGGQNLTGSSLILFGLLNRLCRVTADKTMENKLGNRSDPACSLHRLFSARNYFALTIFRQTNHHQPLIYAKNITKTFGDLQVLKGIDLEIPTGKLYSIVGPSGAGKTTLLQILGTLSNPDSGELLIKDESGFQIRRKTTGRLPHREIGFVFQFHYLLPEFNALENVCLPALIAKKGKKETEERAKELLDFLGLSQRLTHKPSELSGGERLNVRIVADRRRGIPGRRSFLTSLPVRCEACI